MMTRVGKRSMESSGHPDWGEGMPESTRNPPTPVPIGLNSPEFEEICGWRFDDPYVSRLLRDDIPQRMRCRIGRESGRQDGCSDVLFLDVYTSNEKALRLYEKCGFVKVSDESRLDPDEDNRPYFIMARRVSATQA